MINFPIKQNKKILIVSVLYSFFFSLFTVLGHALYDTNSLKMAFATKSSVFRALAIMFILWILSTAVIFCCYAVIKKFRPEFKTGFSKGKKAFFIIWCIIFASWIPCYVAYYPGIYSYDIVGQIGQITTSSYSSHHPPLHTLIFKICMGIGNVIGVQGISVYGLVQMLALSFAMARMLYYFVQKSAPCFFVIVSVIFCSINPIMAIVSLLPIKDVFCAVFLILVTISIFEMVSNPAEFFNSITAMIKLITELLGMCLFRNNAVYALILAAIVFAVVMRDKLKKIILIFLTPTLTYLLIAILLFPSLGIQKGSIIEMMSVPLQQISFVIREHADEIDEETKKEINKVMPYSFEHIGETYNPRFADPIKELASMENGIKPLILCWFKLLNKYPVDFLSAFLSLNLPYWYALASPVDRFSGRIYIETYTQGFGDSCVNDGICGILHGFYEAVASYSKPMDVFPVSMATSIAIPVYLLLLFVIKAVVMKRKVALVGAIPLLFWMTYLLGPVSNFRYLIPIYVLYPALFYVLIYSPRKEITGTAP